MSTKTYDKANAIVLFLDRFTVQQKESEDGYAFNEWVESDGLGICYRIKNSHKNSWSWLELDLLAKMICTPDRERREVMEEQSKAWFL